MSEDTDRSTAQATGRDDRAGTSGDHDAGDHDAGDHDGGDHDAGDGDANAARPPAVTSTGDDDAPGNGSPRPGLLDRLKSTDRVQVGIVFLIGLALVVFVRGVSLGTTGEDRYKLGTHIESVDPIPEATQVPPESAITVDLETGFIGTISIDGVEIETVNIEDFTTAPGQQVDLPPVTIYAPGNATLTFQPQPGSAIERYEPGLHDVTVRYWKRVDGEAGARTFSWKFWVL